MLIKIVISIIVSPLYVFNQLINLLSLLSIQFKKISFDYQLNYLDGLTKKISHTTQNNSQIDLQFYTPNSLCLYRAESFSDKEPETLEWIEEFGKGEAVLFDIGANVGLYSIYHNKLNNGKCFAFEPSFFNLKLLVKNINVNDCQGMTKIISNPLFEEIGFGEFKYGSSVEGGALSAFGVDFGHDGKKIDSQISSNVLGLSLDWMFDNKIVNIPNLVKLDVDGIEHIILKGAKKILMHPDCKSILVEVNDNFLEQSKNVNILLSSYGYTLRDKLHGESTEKSDLFSTNYNQIWVKETDQL